MPEIRRGKVGGRKRRPTPGCSVLAIVQADLSSAEIMHYCNKALATGHLLLRYLRFHSSGRCTLCAVSNPKHGPDRTTTNKKTVSATF